MRIFVLPLDGTFDTGLAAILDTLALADELSASAVDDAGATGPGAAQGDPGGAAPERPRFAVQLVGVRARVRTQWGLEVPVAPARPDEDAAPPDVVIVPALGCKFPAQLGAALARPDTRDAARRLRAWHAAGVTLAAACTGTYVLAHTGLLDGQRATTSWWLGPDFHQRFPAVQLDDSKMVVAQPGLVTAGAALAHVDLALFLVRQRSPALAATTARYLLSDSRPSQAAYAIVNQLAHTDPAVERFERWTREHLATFNMPDAARAAGLSERTLQRHVRRVLGRTPIAYVQDLRVSQAIHRLQTSDDSLDTIAAAVGYEDGVTLRTLLRKKTGRGIRELRGR